ncbi:zinc finger protein 518B [Hippopotamus amphibius kiboko]|uniref:zinc finger protein 518B n=1 Tax=Hippopotamus amphibius kiboko TaxID=575201 RepID=UPI002597A6AE|nr:zinc finger protein 518B [Hippopotamus amphibius kiboko]XP_057562122.1 zinc finger protein 518B [Hippopotamus amphibius kiboko]XP_057562123.1 zinc finger protein 518B [Hippopotamus amphibius kiboko]XP_057562124.1 zinc finger protein 518B [Hippopotamus amphibius kiboko]
MQMKKMKESGQQLWTTQADDGHSSLTMSPKQPNAHRGTRPDRQEAQTLLYQGSEAEAAAMTIATCVKCKSVHKLPLQDLKKGTGQSQKEDKYVCFKCSLGVAPPHFHFVNSNHSATHIGNKTETISSSVNNKFKVRNFKPGKYYCDKCRFSTKDPLQYKKHTLQHEEIKFICSHCSYISYTKGEFQRHLVKHTGIFPYQCEYCDYGAIRNDYIVKHRKRVHEKAGGKRPPKTVAKLEPKRISASKQNPELLRASSPRTAFQNKLSDQLSRFSLHSNKDRMHNIMLLPESKEYQKDVVCVPNKVTLSEPNEVSLFENRSVEVEVLSPAKEPVQPGMPLTVVAPAELVVPANCLAQLIDVKVVNGTQQLVLKLFPLEENNCLDTGGGNVGNSERVTKEKGLSEQEKMASAEQTRSLTIEGNVGKLAGIDNLQSSVQKQLKNVKWVRSYDFFTSNSGVHSGGESFVNPSRVEGLQKKSYTYPHRTALPSIALKGHSPSSLVKNCILSGLGTVSNSFPYKAAVSFPEDGRSLRGDSQQLFPFAASPAAISFSGEKDSLPLGKNDMESRNEISIPVKMVPPHRKLKDNQTQEHKAVSHTGQISSQHKSEYLHINITGEGRIRSQQSGDKPLELKNSEKTNDSFEGPVISSVFSLSSGSENVPEGVKWNSSTSKIKSIELLRRKIAQLIESCGRPSSLAANSAHRHSVGKASKVTSKAAPEGMQEINMSLTSTGCSTAALPKPQDDGGINGHPAHPQMYPQLVEGSSGKTESRVPRKPHVATPVLIPKGAVLRVLNSSEDSHIIEATCEAPVTIPCSETQLIKPIPFRPVKQTDSDLQSSTGESGPIDMSQNHDLSLRPKSRKESANCSSVPKKAGPLHGQQGSSEMSRQGKLFSRSLPVSKSKTKQVNSSKKKSKIQADPSRYFKDPSIFQVARQLRLIAAKPDQLIKCPRRNQPVIVLNHPDVDSPEVSNVMKVINKYKGNVLKVVLSERTRCQLGIRRHHVRLTYQNAEEANQIKRQMMLKMKLKKVHKNNYQVVDSLPDDSSQCIFKCWFCGRLYEDQEEWMSHGQRHLIEATRDWDVLSSKGK